jgi:hypothetical protein
MKSVNLFLRDAGVILKGGKANFWRRLERCAALAGENGLDIQVTLDDHYFLAEHAQSAARLTGQLQKFRKVLLHLHTPYSRPFGRNVYTDNVISILNELIAGCGNIRGICVHPDYTEDFSVLERLKTDDIYIGVEILGKGSRSGNHFSEISEILYKYDFLAFVPDTAHILEMAGVGEPGLDVFLETFGDRVREVHVSRPENLYDPEVMEGGFTTSHSLLTLKKDDDIISSLAAWTPPAEINIVIEGVVPPGEYGEGCLRNEVAYLKKTLCE